MHPRFVGYAIFLTKESLYSIGMPPKRRSSVLKSIKKNKHLLNARARVNKQ
jgi:hypothetical protein